MTNFRERFLAELERHLPQEDGGLDWRSHVDRALSRLGVQDEAPQAGAQIATDPTLQSGDQVSETIIAYRDPFTVPASVQLQGGVYAEHRVELGRNSSVQGDLVADSLLIGGGPQSTFRHIVARTLRFDSAPAIVSGNIWCDRPLWRSQKAELVPQLTVRGVVMVQKSAGEPLLVHSRAMFGGLIAPDAIQTEAHCQIGHLYSDGELTVGRDNRLGRVEGASVTVPHDATVTALISTQGDVAVHGTTTCDTIRARGNVLLGPHVTVTGPVIVAETGTFRIPHGDGWHSKRDHWFYELPDGTLRPVVGGDDRPSGSRQIALQALNHALWQQINELRGAVA
ncbi:MAG: hypothetical protein KDD73_10935 [Anaerolineales bacterium]|nr:hypothetical protein [Anaerolineales bacterium]MCB9127877.1 hypothetical protein [Ardenticatenales bacterium]MCB9171639.1 hypothetical protein [Ardenticatenales bacterium]